MQINSRQDIKNLGTILGLWAHPDDDVFSMGMIMAAAVNNGQKVACVIATRGEAGVQDESRWPAEKLAEIRSSELASAYRILGTNNYHWLDYPDGGCNQIDTNDATDRIAELISGYKPNTILTFGADGLTGHPDHQTVSTWATESAQKSGLKINIFHVTNTPEQLKALRKPDKELNIFFNIDNPPVCQESECDICLCDDEQLYAQKIKALKAMPSQTDKLLSSFESNCRTAFGKEAFILLKRR